MVDDPSEQRRPKRLYREGSEPDPRFTMANERTFLAWIRTALALMAGGVGIEALNAVAERPNALRTALAALLLVTGVMCSAGAFTRWLVTERALRRGTALPAPRMAPVLGYGLAALGIIACVLLLTTGV